jgi:hypothetical protein
VRRALAPATYDRNCDELALYTTRRSGSVDVIVHQLMIPDDPDAPRLPRAVGEQCSIVLVSSQTLAVHGSRSIDFQPIGSK